MTNHSTLEDWLAAEAIPFAPAEGDSFESAVDTVMGALASVELLGLAECLHGSEEILILRNRLFRRLVEKHGYRAIAIETSSPEARAIDDYVRGRRDREDAAVWHWFASGFGELAANRELVEWMREYNQGEDRELHFYGFDLPLAGGSLASPRRVLAIVFDWLDRVGASTTLLERIAPLIEDDSKWERPAAWFEPDQSLGRSAEANELRLAIEDLVIELEIRGPELAGKGRREDYDEALHYARVGRLLMDAHAALATGGAYARMLGIRDLIMAENLLAAFARERRRGKVLAFAATGHLQRAMSEWSLPPEPGVKRWWPAGAQLERALGSRYAVIAQALGSSEANGLDRPELGTLESMLAGVGPAFFAPTRPGQGALEELLAALPVRSGSTLNPTYSPLSPKTGAGADWLLYLDTTAYPRGARPLSSWSG